MKKLLFIFAIGVSMALLTSCEKESIPGSKTALNITASLEIPQEVRGAIDNSLNHVWEIGDIIYVTNEVGEIATKVVTYRVKSVNDGVASFELNSGNPDTAFGSSTTYYAYAGNDPSYSGNLASGNKLRFRIPASQTGVPNVLNPEQLPAAACATLDGGNLHFNFKYICSILKFTIPLGMENVNKVMFQTTAATVPDAVSGIFGAVFSGSDVDGISIISNGGKNVNLLPSSGDYFVPGTYYMVIAPGDKAAGWGLYVYQDKATAAKIKALPNVQKEFSRGVITNLGTISQ